jgi:hypothetical protein
VLLEKGLSRIYEKLGMALEMDLANPSALGWRGVTTAALWPMMQP